MRSPLTREEVIDAAREYIEKNGYARLTMRRLAAELGVSPMAVYRHVENKQDLVDEVVDRMFAERWRPTVSKADPWRWLVEVHDRFRAFLVAEPAALQVFLDHPVTSPANLERLRAVLATLEATGLDEDQARRVVGAVHVFTVGFAAVQASRRKWIAEHQEMDGDAAWLAGLTRDEQFRDGLTALIDAIRNSR